MKKIIVAANSDVIRPGFLDFASYIATLEHSPLTILSLEPAENLSMPAARERQHGEPSSCAVAGEVDTPSAHPLEQAFLNRGLRCSVHEIPQGQLAYETRFADLLIIDPEMSFGDKPEALPSHFAKHILSASECPVLIAPYTFDGIEEIVFAYDGSVSSVFAIKQFTSTFPALCDKRVTVIRVDEKADMDASAMEKIGDLIKMHYSAIGAQIVYGRATDELLAYLLKREDAFVVLGAFGRNRVSSFFRHSTAELLVKTTNNAIFIAHY